MTVQEIAFYFALPKRVYIEIIGGDVDGMYLDSDSGPPLVRHFVKSIYVNTNDGTVGRYVEGMPLSNVLQILRGGSIPESKPGFMHQYHIIERMEEENEVLIRMRHESRKVPPSESQGQQVKIPPA